MSCARSPGLCVSSIWSRRSRCGAGCFASHVLLALLSTDACSGPLASRFIAVVWQRPATLIPRFLPAPSLSSGPLDVVQIDQTPMDIVVADDLYRQPLGKPYLTLATDVATRCILGFVISFVPPGAGTVSLCMTLIVSPKAAWLKQLGVAGDWPMAGLPKTLHLDGAAEFKSKALKRGCGQYGVELVYRERTHHGGHIERLIGTKMSKLKSLPGATGGSPKARRSYDPDKHAALTLGELEAWFAQQIVGRYHQDPHRGLKGGTPAGAWALHPAPALPAVPLKRFRIAFLPAISRTLRLDGSMFEHLSYWHPIFSQWLARRERLTLHFDPRNLSKLYVPHEDDYLEVPFADLRMPAVSLWEVQAATRHLRQAGQKSINPALLIEAIDKQREIVRAARAKTRKMRRKQQAAHRPATGGIDSLNDAPRRTRSPTSIGPSQRCHLKARFGPAGVVDQVLGGSSFLFTHISPPRLAPSLSWTIFGESPTWPRITGSTIHAPGRRCRNWSAC